MVSKREEKKEKCEKGSKKENFGEGGPRRCKETTKGLESYKEGRLRISSLSKGRRERGGTANLSREEGKGHQKGGKKVPYDTAGIKRGTNKDRGCELQSGERKVPRRPRSKSGGGKSSARLTIVEGGKNKERGAGGTNLRQVS